MLLTISFVTKTIEIMGLADEPSVELPETKVTREVGS
jgi:hypothetical protein